MISVQLSVSVAELQTGQSQINSTVVGIDATVTEIDERVIKMEQNGKIIPNLFPVMEIEASRSICITSLQQFQSFGFIFQIHTFLLISMYCRKCSI